MKIHGLEKFISRSFVEIPPNDVGCGAVPKTTIRWDEGLKADAERCARERGIPVAEFVRQSIAHYVAWCAAQKEAENDPKPCD